MVALTTFILYASQSIIINIYIFDIYNFRDTYIREARPHILSNISRDNSSFYQNNSHHIHDMIQSSDETYPQAVDCDSPLDLSCTANTQKIKNTSTSNRAEKQSLHQDTTAKTEKYFHKRFHYRLFFDSKTVSRTEDIRPATIKNAKSTDIFKLAQKNNAQTQSLHMGNIMRKNITVPEEVQNTRETKNTRTKENLSSWSDEALLKQELSTTKRKREVFDNFHKDSCTTDKKQNEEFLKVVNPLYNMKKMQTENDTDAGNNHKRKKTDSVSSEQFSKDIINSGQSFAASQTSVTSLNAVMPDTDIRNINTNTNLSKELVVFSTNGNAMNNSDIFKPSCIHSSPRFSKINFKDSFDILYTPEFLGLREAPGCLNLHRLRKSPYRSVYLEVRDVSRTKCGLYSFILILKNIPIFLEVASLDDWNVKNVKYRSIPEESVSFYKNVKINVNNLPSFDIEIIKTLPTLKIMSVRSFYKDYTQRIALWRCVDLSNLNYYQEKKEFIQETKYSVGRNTQSINGKEVYISRTTIGKFVQNIEEKEKFIKNNKTYNTPFMLEIITKLRDLNLQIYVLKRATLFENDIGALIKRIYHFNKYFVLGGEKCLDEMGKNQVESVLICAYKTVYTNFMSWSTSLVDAYNNYIRQEGQAKLDYYAK
ncbi:hypothetical protein CDIK_3177 [Cucumispora dikerogammari]|nr:hypothetical protein CDIK_3177 [Cucumispora dikerogammari]